MIPLFSDDILKQSKQSILLPLQCKNCTKVFYRTAKRIRDALRPHTKDVLDYCSHLCHGATMITKQQVQCHMCHNLFMKFPNQIKKDRRNFCSHSCRAQWQNKHKTHGVRRSKLEKWIEEQLTTIYPNLEIHYNRLDAIDIELDIYIPSLKLAFELNGIFHYMPIYGDKKFTSIKTNDQYKLEACKIKNIDLYVIDISSQAHFTPEKSRIFLDAVQKFISQKLAERSGPAPHPPKGPDV